MAAPSMQRRCVDYNKLDNSLSKIECQIAFCECIRKPKQLFSFIHNTHMLRAVRSTLSKNLIKQCGVDVDFLINLSLMASLDPRGPCATEVGQDCHRPTHEWPAHDPFQSIIRRLDLCCVLCETRPTRWMNEWTTGVSVSWQHVSRIH